MYYWYQNKFVKDGEIINIGNLNIEVSLSLVNNNRELFTPLSEIEYWKCTKTSVPYYKINKVYCYPELSSISTVFLVKGSPYLQFDPSTKFAYEFQKKCSEKFPVGTKVQLFNKTSVTITAEDVFVLSPNENIGKLFRFPTFLGNIYESGDWATIKKFVTVTQDGKDLYEGDPYYFLWTKNPYKDRKIFTPYYVAEKAVNTTFSDDVVVFSTLQAANEWIENNNSEFQLILKVLKNTPLEVIPNKQLFYRNIYQSLVSFYNKGWLPTPKDTKYFIGKTSREYPNDVQVIKHESVLYPMPYFKNETDAYKTLNIMKKYINYIF